MIIHEFTFNTEAEASAFIQGVDFVNDSSLGGPIMFRDEESGKWTAEVHDYDYSHEDEPSADDEELSAVEDNEEPGDKDDI
jgi:hypothetical protein